MACFRFHGGHTRIAHLPLFRNTPIGNPVSNTRKSSPHWTPMAPKLKLPHESKATASALGSRGNVMSPTPLWRKFTVVVLKEEHKISRSDMEFLNSNCYHEGRRIPWESGIMMVAPLNRNRWSLNVEATVTFKKQWHATLHIFFSEHEWKDGEPMEKEAVMMLGQGDDSAQSRQTSRKPPRKALATRNRP
ncbi:hypothetical protein CEP51_016563 [Fusarium floridanum]|uniref:Uncharacterized protein n=2 Tax=Fusarium solani species complex TaxID=232080 RepID=A0A428NLL1_9HYPO|nr:hypothetical protein CEP51_016563 [Fusarium floridanum]